MPTRKNINIVEIQNIITKNLEYLFDSNTPNKNLINNTEKLLSNKKEFNSVLDKLEKNLSATQNTFSNNQAIITNLENLLKIKEFSQVIKAADKFGQETSASQTYVAWFLLYATLQLSSICSACSEPKLVKDISDKKEFIKANVISQYAIYTILSSFNKILTKPNNYSPKNLNDTAKTVIDAINMLTKSDIFAKNSIKQTGSGFYNNTKKTFDILVEIGKTISSNISSDKNSPYSDVIMEINNIVPTLCFFNDVNNKDKAPLKRANNY